ncbi:MAG: transposase [Methylococcales bacterium]
MTRRLEHLLEIQQMERNRLESADAAVTQSIATILNAIDNEIQTIRDAIEAHIGDCPDLDQRRKLLESAFPVSVLPRSPAFARCIQSLPQGFTDAKQVVAFAGLAPAVRQSGTWVGQTRISKNGDPVLRKVLYMPALSAWAHNPVIREFCLRLKANGKNGKAIVCAAACVS